MMSRLQLLCVTRPSLNPITAAILFLLCNGIVSADVVFTVGDGSSVTKIDRLATFDAIDSDGLSLSNYAEGGLNILVPSPEVSAVGLDVFGDGTTLSGYHFGSEGNTSVLRISTPNRTPAMFGLELRLGHGFIGVSTTNLLWLARRGGAVTGSGFEVGLLVGERVGWQDQVNGFDELFLAANPNFSIASQLGDFQAIAVDDVFVSTSAVPEPSCHLFCGFALAALKIRRRRG